MILYISYCPRHKQKKLTIKQTELVNVKQKDGTSKKTPIFYCDQCKAYYLYTSNANNHLKKSASTYHNLPVYFTNENYSLIKQGIQIRQKTQGYWFI